MNAYIASFMLLLFNAVGLAVPASAATAERMVPELGSAAQLADAEGISRAAVTESTAVMLADHSFPAATAIRLVPHRTSDAVGIRKPVWADVAMPSDSGDKLEHEEGAP